MISVFLDSSVLFSYMRSQTGASALVLALCKQRLIKGYVSSYVIAETRKNILLKLGKGNAIRFEQILSESYLAVESEPISEKIEQAALHIHKKDAVILAIAIKAKVGYLLTLDVRHFLQNNVRYFAKPVEITIPGEFIKQHRSLVDKLE